MQGRTKVSPQFAVYTPMRPALLVQGAVPAASTPMR